MNNRFRIFILMLVLCLLSSTALAASTNEDTAYGLVVDKIEWETNANGERGLQVHLKNNTKEPIYLYALSLTLKDDQDELVFAYPMDEYGYFDELQLGLAMTPQDTFFPMNPGTVTKIPVILHPGYAKVTKALAGINYYQSVNGQAVYVMPQSILWKSTTGEEIAPQERGQYLPGLTKQQQEKADSVALGLMLAPDILTDERAPLYGEKAGGAFIIDRTKSGLAKMAGMEIGDVLIAVDGIRLVDDPRAIFLGKIKMAEGKKVVFQWQHGEETKENTLSAK